MLLKSAKSIYKGSDEVASLYLGGNLIWTKPTAEEEEGNWFIGVTSDGNPYNVKLNGSTISVNSGEKYFIEEPLTSTYDMFYNLVSLTSLDVSHLDTSNVTIMRYMFANCIALTSLNLSNWDTTNVFDMGSMFSYCKSLTSLNLSNWDTSNVTNMGSMFDNCTALTTVTGPITGIGVNISLSSSPLTHDSAMVFLNGLATVSSTKTITFKSTTYDTLTPEEIALATSKGWSVARS